MLSRIMRHPAGFMKKALSGNFLAGAFRQLGPAAPPPPAYWLNRFSSLGLVLMTPLPPVPGAGTGPGAAVRSAPVADALLPAQGGKASSFLGSPERTGARPARP